MRHFRIIIVFVPLLMVCSCQRDELAGKQYVGNYHPIEWISIDFKPGGQVTGRIGSTDAAGWFRDKAYGHYGYDDTQLTLSWDHVPVGNLVYHHCPSDPDSIVVSPSLDSLVLYEGEEKYVLERVTESMGHRIGGDVIVFFMKYSIILVAFFLAFILALVIRLIRWLTETGV